MKKLIAVVTLFLGFAFSANAQQDNKLSAENAAKMDAVKLSEAVGLQGTQQENLVQLFVMKYNVMNDPSVTAERKNEMAKVVEAKLRASLNAEQIKKLDADPALLSKMTGATPATPKK